MTPIYFWKTTQQFAKPTRKLASFVFQLKLHAAPVETLFSSLSYSKPKIKNKMMTDNLWIDLQVSERKHPHSVQE